MSSTSSPCESHCLSTADSANSARLETGGRGGLWKRRQEGYSNRLHIKALNIIQVLFGNGCIPFRCISFYHSTSLALFQLRVKRRCRKSSAKVPFKPVDLAAPNVQNMHRRHMFDFFFFSFFVVFWGLFMVWILFWKSSIRVMFVTENQCYKRVNVWSAFSVWLLRFFTLCIRLVFPCFVQQQCGMCGYLLPCWIWGRQIAGCRQSLKNTHIFAWWGKCYRKAVSMSWPLR